MVEIVQFLPLLRNNYAIMKHKKSEKEAESKSEAEETECEAQETFKEEDYKN